MFPEKTEPVPPYVVAAVPEVITFSCFEFNSVLYILLNNIKYYVVKLNYANLFLHNSVNNVIWWGHRLKKPASGTMVYIACHNGVQSCAYKLFE